ncbi:phosphoribosyl transferase [Burkholderia territorii]|uniref:phosphoribosyltransferase n=1 Tax=Burkholderia TaxID=32008 RepID=UPI000753AD8F|nr:MULTISPECIES: phosphoribosyltransferase family protein [Burkholderia]KUY55120.1 phosphoribosyl transferase [Burkholderia sp. RF2-non_BP3]KUY85428.1 phosphoribosyl transferase [Burkholderia territorii]KUZ21844.1 phosphoribosyl transferase [Burkholderia territorii]KUZ38203.1 phosphoribosyl transferase [Burkholderia territorii]KUZ59286.1 phosphoribosyl transferase [Burkholderia territorii]
MIFDDRRDAANQLASVLQAYRGERPLVLAIPRGALILGSILATRLHGDLDVVLVRKLRAPWHPELAIGAIDESGWCYLSRDAVRMAIPSRYLEAEQHEQLAVLAARRTHYARFRPPVVREDRITIVVDDGIATGATMIAALHAARMGRPRLLVCAVPVACARGLDVVRPYADEVVCIEQSDEAFSVGAFYRSFSQVDDDEAVAILAAACRSRTGEDTVPR